MFRIKPTYYVKHVSDINYEKLKAKNIKLICFDIDNTLDVPDKITDEILPEIERTLKKVEELGFEIFLISNNTIEGRVNSFASIRDYKYLDGARKPFQKKYKKIEELKKYSKSEIIFVGDKLVTDILGASWYGSPSILVDPLVPRTKNWYSGFMSFSDSVFSFLNGFKRGRYYD